jgi:hypothetical protein
MEHAPGNPDNTPLSSAKRLLLAYLAEHDVPCPVCHYNLRNLTHDVCPECGQQFRLTVGAVNVRFGALLLFLAPMIAVSGLAFLFLCIVCIDPGPMPFGAYVILVTGTLDVLAAFVAYRRRVSFLVQPRNTRALLIGLAWMANITIVGLSIASFP